MNNNYTLKNRGHDIWDIFDAKGKIPFVSLECDQIIAQTILESFNDGKGTPPDLAWAIKKGKEIKS